MMDRDELRRKAYMHYTLAEFKDWAADQASEMSQQLLRLRTARCDKEELIKTALMVEDACAMLWLLLKPDAKLIEDIKEDVYCEFESMIKEQERLRSANLKR